MSLSAPCNDSRDLCIPANRDSNGVSRGREQTDDIRFRWMGFALLFVIVFCLLAWREPTAISKPSFVAEDGFAFFKQSYEEPFWRIVFRPHAGYIQLVPRLLAELGSFAPLEFIPLVYALSALLVATLALTFFALPPCRNLIKSDALRAVVVLALPFMPNADGLTRVCAVHWYLLFFLVLTSLVTLPGKRLARVALWMAAALSFWSQPVAIVCVPVLFYRVWRAAPGAERHWWFALSAVAVAYPLTAQSQSALQALWHTPDVLLSLRHAIGLRVLCFFFLGQDFSRLALAHGWLVVMCSASLGLGLCAAAACWPGLSRRPGRGLGLAFLLYYVLLLPVPYILRVEIIPDFVAINQETWLANQRYFCVSVLLLCVFFGVAYQETGCGWKRHAAAGAVLACWLGLHGTNYRLWDYQSHPGWPHFVRNIRRAEQQVQQTGGGRRVAIQTSPYIFVLDVGSPSPSDTPQW